LLAKKDLLHMLFTQNIDCLERRAGVPADKIIEAHGSFATQRCIECKKEFPDDDMKAFVMKGEVPRCKDANCKGLVKPDIVFFGEQLPKAFDHNAYQTAMADLVLIIGTSLTVYPFASLPDMAKQDKPRVLFNMERVGQLGRRPDDVLELGACDDGIRKLADELGWRDELEELWRGIVGEKEAQRQLESEATLEEDEDEEVQKLTEEVEAALKLEDAGSRDTASDLVDIIRQHLEGKVEPTEEATAPSGGVEKSDAPQSSLPKDSERDTPQGLASKPLAAVKDALSNSSEKPQEKKTEQKSVDSTTEKKHEQETVDSAKDKPEQETAGPAKEEKGDVIDKLLA
jgi:NAD-dependent histone deacetylase SIR2